MTLLKHELKQNLRTFLIWTICIGAMCYGCILMYGSVEESLSKTSELFDTFSDMGAMSAAFGMDRLSLATLSGYYATEIAMIHSLGGAMFAAVLACNLLSKEELGHTVEFLCVLPISRAKIVAQKYIAIVIYLAIFQVVCTGSYMVAFAMMEEEIPVEKMMALAGTQYLLMLEIAAICYMISAFSKKNMMGAGLGIALLFFALDMMCRVVPAMENVKYITPFYYANATDIFTDTEIAPGLFVIGVAITVGAYCLAYKKYSRKDLS